NVGQKLKPFSQSSSIDNIFLIELELITKVQTAEDFTFLKPEESFLMWIRLRGGGDDVMCASVDARPHYDYGEVVPTPGIIFGGTQGLANYCPDQRYQNWKRGFDRGCNSDLFESFNLDSHPESKDPNDIYLADVIYQLKTWEEKLENYGSIHKTDLFHDFQDSKYKLLVKLDDIDVSRNPERREKRLKIYDRVNNLAKKLDS
ncbi:unnamed protein product, partial [Allacma fusca]